MNPHRKILYCGNGNVIIGMPMVIWISFFVGKGRRTKRFQSTVIKLAREQIKQAGTLTFSKYDPTI